MSGSVRTLPKLFLLRSLGRSFESFEEGQVIEGSGGGVRGGGNESHGPKITGPVTS